MNASSLTELHVQPAVGTYPSHVERPDSNALSHSLQLLRQKHASTLTPKPAAEQPSEEPRDSFVSRRLLKAGAGSLGEDDVRQINALLEP
ncbi:MAG: hypothetical protein IPJ21_01335 [Sterolibacteriaceae bacterium]|nr:hypothetical protein [Sterolibacteriaceae bacterium]MBK9086304.1 hypothetical protein [Sterolibacteriaceae bacterium]